MSNINIISGNASEADFNSYFEMLDEIRIVKLQGGEVIKAKVLDSTAEKCEKNCHIEVEDCIECGISKNNAQ